MAGIAAPWSPGQVAAGADVHPSPNIFAGAVLLQKGLQTGASGLAPPVVTTPPVPATTVPVTNATGVDVMAYLTSGGAAVSAIAVNGTATGMALGTSGSVPVYLPAYSTITLTYASTAPTWKWLAV